jgi:DNA-binding ferritin-like protein
MVRNFVIVVLTIATVLFAYRDHQASSAAEQRSQLIIETREKAEKEMQALRDKLAAEERARQVAEKDAKAVSAKLAEEQTARDAAEQTAKASSERLSQVQTALAVAEQVAKDAREALDKAQKARDEALAALASERSRAAGQPKPAG